MNDQIDTYIRREIRQEAPDELIIYDSAPAVKRKQINKLYQKGIDYEEQWRSHPEVGKVVDEFEQQLEKAVPEQLSGHWKTLLGTNTGLRIIPDNSTIDRDYIYIMISRALNQRDMLQGKQPTHSVSTIKASVWAFVESQLEGEPGQGGVNDDEDFPGRPAWQLFLHNLFEILSPISQAYKTDMTREAFKELYLSINHILTFHELTMISRIYNVHFIIIRDRRYPYENEDDSWIICLNTTQTTSEWYIILDLVGYEKYNIIVDTSTYMDAYQYRYIFNQSKKEIPDVLFNRWQTECPKDHKTTLDKNNDTLTQKITPEPMLLQTLRTGDVYPVSPRSGRVIPAHAIRPEGVNVAPPQKKFIIRKITVTQPEEIVESEYDSGDDFNFDDSMIDDFDEPISSAYVPTIAPVPV